MDGISFQVLIADMEKVYEGQTMLRDVLQYPDFAVRQRAAIDKLDMTEGLTYWKAQFTELPPVLPLFPKSLVKARRSLTKYELNVATFSIGVEVATKIRKVAKEARTTTFHFYLAALKCFLFRSLPTTDLVIGIADANRNDSDTTEAIGMYLNLLPIRLKLNALETFSDALIEAKKQTFDALKHSFIPFDVLLDKLNVPRSTNHSPLFQAFIDYRQGVSETQKFGNCVLKGEDYSLGRTAYDISLDIIENTGGSVLIKMKTQSYLYSQDTTEAMLKMIMKLIKCYASNPDNLTREAPMYDETAVELALQIGHGPVLENEWPATITQRIDEMILAHPARVAIKDGDCNSMTYKQIGFTINAIATLISKADLAKESTIAVFQQPSVYWICSMLAIQRTGAIYVPLDPQNPPERLQAIMKISKAAAILVHDSTATAASKLHALQSRIINVSSIPASGTLSPLIPNTSRPSNVAVLLFTSGTTGIPKGILLSHASLRNEVEGYSKTWQIGSEVVLQQSALSFDFSLDQIYSALCNAGTLFIVPQSKRKDPSEIAKIILHENITYTKATPSEYSSWINNGASSLAKTRNWRKAFAGGEPLTDNHRQKFRSLNIPHLKLFNSYGPGEITISSSKIHIPYDLESCNSSDVIPAGKTLPNYSVYVVDETLQAVPLGISGEILIGGAGVALGYLNNEDVTGKKFINDKYATTDYLSKDWKKAYRTGDRGHLRADGALVFESRIDGDTQIKLRGLRIELEDIESNIILASDNTIVDAAVSVRGEEQFLVAHVVFDSTCVPDDRERVITKLKNDLPLPQYMCPSLYVILENMPLTLHRKLDRRAIGHLQLPQFSATVVSDLLMNDMETSLRDVWEEVLPEETVRSIPIGIDTNFFHVGGNSVILPRLRASIRRCFSVVLSISELFDSSTLRAMASQIMEKTSADIIDWNEETSITAMASELKILETLTLPKHGDAKKEVLLTGSNGFLGRAILDRLVDDDNIIKIHCIAVRSHHRKHNRKSKFNDKIITYTGDLTSPLLGLTLEQFTNLARKIDVIIHSAAVRSFWEYYQLLRAVNVESTKTLISMAQPRKIPIHFISSGGLSQILPMLNNNDTALEKDLNICCPASSVAYVHPVTVDGSNGYLCSKWASEVSLENASQKFQIPVIIHRPSGFSGQSNSATARAHILNMLVQGARSINFVPDFKGWSGDFSLLPVSEISESICSDISHSEDEVDINFPSSTTTASTTSATTHACLMIFKHYRGVAKITIQDMREEFERKLIHGKIANTTTPTLTPATSPVSAPTSTLTSRLDSSSMSPPLGIETEEPPFQSVNLLKWFGKLKEYGRFDYMISSHDITFDNDGEVLGGEMSGSVSVGGNEGVGARARASYNKSRLVSKR